MIKHLSLFSGLGGASSALRQAEKNYETLAISELEPKSLKVYEAIHGQMPHNEGDIIALSKDNERLKFYLINEKPDLISGGYPCQPFSYMNLKKGELLKDARYQAALALRDIVNLLQPKYVILENIRAIFTAPYKKRTKEFLDGFRNYTYRVDFANPKDFGYHQSRGRYYILFSREDVTPWIPGKMVNRKRKFKFDKDPEPSQFYKIFPPRVKLEVDLKDPKFQCLAARSCDAHCGRFSWIPYEYGHRSPTPNELFQLFGYKKYPKIKAKQYKGISRGALYHAFGNSWHIGHATAHMKTLPLK